MPKNYHQHYSIEQSTRIVNEVVRLLKGEKLFLAPQITAKQLAAQMGCRPQAVSAAMAKVTGHNFNHLLARIRAEEAAKLLRHPDYRHTTLDDIALASGFASRQLLHKAFNTFYEISPHQYRLQTQA